jgi:ribosome-associated protein YbcJ (S4-like RNA binding protein)
MNCAAKKYADKRRRTRISDEEQIEFDPEKYIVRENSTSC